MTDHVPTKRRVGLWSIKVCRKCGESYPCSAVERAQDK